jgi:hypothetical protein
MGAHWATELKAKLDEADPSDDAVFAELVGTTLEATNTSDADAAEILGVSRPTVTRWRLRQSVPHPAIRSTIFKMLKDQISLHTLKHFRRLRRGQNLL